MDGRGGMCSGVWVQDSNEILALARAGARILPARSVIIGALYRDGRGGMYSGVRVQDSNEILALV